MGVIYRWFFAIWGAGSALPQKAAAGHHGFAGPALGNLLVAGLAGLVTVVCVVIALRMLISPGESDPRHPKYRVLDKDR
jgi:hypothetical protein